ncbi:hypothetical protein Bca4012_072843 [Brassica carinata]
MLKVEYSTRFRDKEKMTKKLQENVSIDSIHPQPPPGDTKGFELMEKVEAYHNDGCAVEKWCLEDGKRDRSTADSECEAKTRRSCKKGKHVVGMKRKATAQPVDRVKEGKPVVGMKRKSTAQPVDRVKEEKLVVGMKRKAIAQLVDRLAFLQREEKRPIVPRNPPMHVTPEHVDAAFAMLNQKTIEQSSWFSEQGIPKAWFVLVQYLEMVGYSYENLQKPDKKGIKILKGWVDEVVRGLIRPNKMWMQDVDIVYGVVYERLVDHFIGVEIYLMENTITIFHCVVQKVKENPLIQKLAVLIPAIKLEMMNEEIKFNDIVPFQVKKAEGLPKTKLPFNCGLFVVKMLECISLRLKKISNTNDETAMDL